MRSLSIVVGLACILTTVSGHSFGDPGRPGLVTAQPEFEEFKGRVEPVAKVELRPRLGGYLSAVYFKDGAKVKRGDVLFEIDSGVYLAQFNAAKAQVAASEASLRFATATNDRFKNLAKQQAGAVSVEELDKNQALQEQAVANFALAKAKLVEAQLNLDWTKVTSPMEGRISRPLLSPGNHVSADMTPLAMIVSEEPMYVVFEMDQDKHLQLVKLAKSAGKGPLTVLIGLAGDKETFPYRGIVDSVPVAAEPDTGKVLWRAVVNGLDPAVLPGFNVRVRVATKK
jgi:RND family efflux transporter MFP subunit